MIRRFITQNLRLLFLFVSVMPMLLMAQGGDVYYNVYDASDKIRVEVGYNGDQDYLKYYLEYLDENGVVTETITDNYKGSFLMDKRPATLTVEVHWHDSEYSDITITTDVAKYYGLASTALTAPFQYNGTVNAPNIIPALPTDATVTYASGTAVAAPKNSIDKNTGVVTINSITSPQKDTYAAYFKMPATQGAGFGPNILNIYGNSGYELGTFTLEVTKRNISDCTVSLSPETYTYFGSAMKPTVNVKVGTYSFNEGANGDYTVSYPNEIKDAGTYTITITPTSSGRLTGLAVTKTFTMERRSFETDQAKVTLGSSSMEYNGTELHPTVSVAFPSPKGGFEPSIDASNYTVSYANATNVGTATVTVTGTGNYTGTASAQFTITAKSLSGAQFSTIPDQTYTGNEIKPEPTVTLGSATLVKGTDFDFSYSSNTNVPVTANDVPTVTITGKGNFTGTASTTFKIVKATPTVTAPTAKTGLAYTGSAQALVNAGSVTAGTLQYKLGAGGTYGTTIPSATEVGSYAVYYKVVGDANYNDVAEAGPINVTIGKAAGSISYATSSISKTFGDAAFTNALTKTGDGAVSYSSSNTNVATVNATSGEVTIVGNGSAVITATVADGTNYTYATKTATYTLSVGTAAMTVSATGYTGAYDGQAHGITVTAPAGATVKYGTSAGTYNLNASPTYTNAGSYTVYYEVTKANYTTVTGSAVVNISKASASISYATASVGKTFGDVPFTNSLTNTGDGAVTYSSSNTNVATVNATSGEVTIVGNGSTTITATVTDGTNYTYAAKTATYTLSVGTAAMTVSATGYTGAYDGQAHGITVTAPAGATVKYGETAGTYNLNASPTYTNAGTYTVYYQVTKTGFDTVTGSATVTITKVDARVVYVNYEFTAKIGEPFDPPYLTLEPSDLAVTYYSADKDIATVDAQTGGVTLVAPGKVNIYAEFAGDENYNSASDYYILTVLQRDIDPIDEDNTITMSDNDFLTTNDEGQQEEVRLDNTVIYDILYTLNISGDPSESDGYDETEQCVVLNHPVTDREINRIINGGNEPGSEEYADEYTGLTFKVPAGTGYVIIDSRTDGDYQMMVKIGNLSPIAFNHTGREKDSVLYECSVPTWVYVYNGGKVSNARMAVDHRAKKQKGHVKIYSVTRSSAKSSGIERINIDALESERWYDLQGNRIQRPTKKGLYILQGQKVVVK